MTQARPVSASSASSVSPAEDGPPVIRLVRPDVRSMEAAVAGDDSLATALGHDVAPGWATFTEALRTARDALVADPNHGAWGTRFFVFGESPVLVGWGGFKGPPHHGVVELGYEIAASYRCRGLATAALRAMLVEAWADERVTTVNAHTLPEPNASNAVLQKIGFRFAGETTDQGQPAWRFQLRRSGQRVE